MRLYELEEHEKEVKCTATFCKERQKLDYNASKFLADFVEHKRTSTDPWGKKDYRFTGSGPLNGLWHAHIIFGQVIAIYAMTQYEVKLCRLVDHSYVDGMSKKAAPLASYITNLSPNDYNECFVPEIATASKTDLIDLMYDIAVNDPDVLRPILTGNDSDFMDFAIMTMDEDINRDAREHAIRNTFGGAGGLKAQVEMIFKSIGL